MLELTSSSGRITIRLSAIQMGNDLCVTITGGDHPHLGAVAIAIPQTGLNAPTLPNASSSVLTLPGHNDDRLARSIAHTLAEKLMKHVAVCSGIHVDNITQNEIFLVFEMAHRLALKLPGYLQDATIAS